jgi:chloramphenicol-sensitive protein RarD
MTTNHIVEASLGYFMNPLMNVFLGRLFLGESLSIRKWVALAFAFFGVMTMFYGKVDGIEISILLASTFALYGLIRKQLEINSEFGLLFELLFASIPALLFFISGGSEQYEFYLAPLSLKLLFICCGLITIIPLFYFVYAAKRLQFSQVGILQYIAPFLQLLVGTVIYGESFTKTHLISFVLIWSAIIIFMSKEVQTLLTTKKVGRNV